RTLLSRCPNLRVLATSRQTLGVNGETVWRVPSLAVPKMGGRAISLADIQRASRYQNYAAVRLFTERAGSAEMSFRASPKSVVSIVKICSLLDGIPLAIELAAARVNVLSVEKIAERLNDRFRILLADRRIQGRGPIP